MAATDDELTTAPVRSTRVTPVASPGAEVESALAYRLARPDLMDSSDPETYRGP